MGREIQKIWNIKVEIIPIVVRSFGAIPKLGSRLNQIGIAAGKKQVQKTILLGSTGVLRKVLEM